MCIGAYLTFFLPFIILVIVFLLAKSFLQHQQAIRALGIQSGVGLFGASRRGTANGMPYECRYHPGGKNTPPSLTVSIPVHSRVKFEIQRERAWDGWSKRLGISEEVQIGDPEFDRRFYLYAFDQNFITGYLGDPKRRHAVEKIFGSGFSRIRNTGKHIEICLKPYSRDRWARHEEWIEDAAGTLADLAQGLCEIQTSGSEEAERAWAFRRNIFYAIAIASCVFGFFLFLWTAERYQPLQMGRLFMYSLRFSIPAAGFFIVAALRLLKGTSYSHRHLGPLILFSAVGFVVFGIGAVLFLNGHRDLSLPLAHITHAGQKWTSHSKSRTHYHISFPSWLNTGDAVQLKIPRTVYDQITPGRTRVRVHAKKGNLGFEWIESYQIEAPAGPGF